MSFSKITRSFTFVHVTQIQYTLERTHHNTDRNSHRNLLLKLIRKTCVCEYAGKGVFVLNLGRPQRHHPGMCCRVCFTMCCSHLGRPLCHCPGMFCSASEAPTVFRSPMLHENDKYECVMAHTTTHAYVT